MMQLRAITPVLALIALGSCGASDGAANKPVNGGATMDNATLTKLALTSDAFRDGQPIPTVYSCDGANHSPALHWSDPPAGTKSFALVGIRRRGPGFAAFEHTDAHIGEHADELAHFVPSRQARRHRPIVGRLVVLAARRGESNRSGPQ